LTVDAAFQFTSKNELARGYRGLGNEITTTVAYVNEKVPMDGFTNIEYCHTPKKSLLGKFTFHWKMLKSTWTSSADVLMFGFQAAHLIPFAALFGFRRDRPKFILDIRTVPVDVSSGLKGKLELWRYQLSIKIADWFCDGMTVITPMLGDTVRPLLKRIHEHMGVWTSGVHLEQFEREGVSRRDELGLTNKKVLLYHGVLSPNRGLQNALCSMGLLRDEFPDLVFLFVGDGSGRLELENLARDLNLMDRVIFTGRVPYNEVPEYVRAADMAILPFPNITWWAVSSPIKLMEYLAIGIPVVATDIDANRWVVEQTGGATLADDDQPESLAKAIRWVIENGVLPADRKVLQQTISWERQAKSLEQFVKQL
jgi:glycosyltransferase involved in cell wall biosynthesis